VEIDERTLAALGRLTANEKECLRRRLLPQTAKEMAIDLSISPHAVEKRLKMARTKLGLSSSLDAARMLAGYERALPQKADLADASEADQVVRAAPGNRRRLYLISGVALMSMILAALVAFAPAQPQTAPPDPAPGMRKASLDDATAFIREGFAQKDRDHSGFLDRDEVSAMEPRDAHRDPKLAPAPASGQPDPAASAKWLGKMDRNGDARVSEGEYLDYMTPWILLSGVPIGWKPRD